jgi:hypothetical protein
MVRDMVSGVARRVELPNGPQYAAYTIRQPGNEAIALSRLIPHQQVQQAGDIAIFNRQAAVHIEFTELELGIERQLPDRGVVVKADGDMGFSTAECFDGISRETDGEGSLTYDG